MIGDITEVTLAAAAAGAFLGRLELSGDDHEYAALREPLVGELRTMGLEGINLPETHADFETGKLELLARVFEVLRERRGQLMGDTTALPVFQLTFLSVGAVARMALGVPDDRAPLELALDDLGLGKDFLHRLEREAGLVALRRGGTPENPVVDKTDVALGALAFVGDVLERLVDEADADELRERLSDLTSEVREFRQEFHAQTQALASLVREGNMAVVSALTEVQARLISAGLDSRSAAALTEADPPTFWERVVRWFGGADPRDAGEAALWAALDFVPGGTGVKLGIKVAEAVRRSLKDRDPRR
jgi:hypothetical protein